MYECVSLCACVWVSVCVWVCVHISVSEWATVLWRGFTKWKLLYAGVCHILDEEPITRPTLPLYLLCFFEPTLHHSDNHTAWIIRPTLPLHLLCFLWTYSTSIWQPYCFNYKTYPCFVPTLHHSDNHTGSVLGMHSLARCWNILWLFAILLGAGGYTLGSVNYCEVPKHHLIAILLGAKVYT
jgi:hypothetical protein